MFPEKGLGLMEDWIAGGRRGQSCHQPGGRGQVWGTQLGGLGNGKDSHSRDYRLFLHQTLPVALPLFPGVGHSWTLKSLCLFSDPKKKKQHTWTKWCREAGTTLTYSFIRVPTKVYLYIWRQSESSPRDDQTIRRSEPLVERLIQNQIYLHTLKSLRSCKYK